MKSVTVQLTLPEDLARNAEAVGLLTSEAYEDLLRKEIRRRAFEDFLSVAKRSAELGLTPMSDEEAQAEVDAVRAERRQRRASRS